MYRLGIVSFINTYPLIESLAQRADVALTPETPRRLAELLLEGLLDAAIAPVAEYLVHRDRYQIIPGPCIGCRGDVQSVRLLSRRGIGEIRSLLLDPASLSSNLLARVILRERFGLEPQLLESPGRQDYLKRLRQPDADAAVVIGDLALRLHNGLEAHDFAVNLDLGRAWMEWTGLPFVFAVWLAPRSLDPAPLTEMLCKARDAGIRAIPALAERAARSTGLPVSVCEQYLRHNVTYHLDDDHRRGLERFERAVQPILEKELV
ncbi:MAG: menaquinone biosynthesis protein [Candidatus Sumerlaeia bacterium]